ncbi:MAG: plasmid mobilization protein [Clostridium chrysemydis]|uniref:plasmid mobilization protein n=1 Tax=Clostridium chrysemydis TaxID=2665504 RepID=UPI003F369389
MKKTEVIQIRLTQEEKNKLQEISRKNRMSMSEFLLYGAMKVISESEFYNNQMSNLK